MRGERIRFVDPWWISPVVWSGWCACGDCKSKDSGNDGALRIKTVGPAPASDDVGFVRFECGGGGLNMLFGCGGVSADEVKVRGNPREIQRSQRAEKVSAI